MPQEQSLRSVLVPLLSHEAIGLLPFALVADVLASDARSNKWFLVEGRRTLSDDELLENLDRSEDAGL